MGRTFLRILAAATAAAALSASGFTSTAAAQSDQQPTHAELVQRWAEAGIDAQLKGMKTGLRLTADQEKDWGPFESAVKAAQQARLRPCKRSKAPTCRRWIATRQRRIASQQSQADLEKIVEAAKPLYASLEIRAETQVHRAWAQARA